MSFCLLSQSSHVLFTTKPEPAGFYEQCDKIMQWSSYHFTAQALLGISDIESTSSQEINKAYKLLILRFHPDKHPNTEVSSTIFSILKDALNYVLYQKGELTITDMQSNRFVATYRHSTDLNNKARFDFAAARAECEKFFDELFNSNLSDWSEEQLKELEKLKSAVNALKQKDHTIALLKKELSDLERHDFYQENSSKNIEKKKDELLNQINTISNQYIKQFKKLEIDLFYNGGNQQRLTHLVENIINNTRKQVSLNANASKQYVEKYEQFFSNHLTRLQINWDAMVKKAEELEGEALINKKYEEAAKQARTLVTKLTDVQKLFRKPTIEFPNDQIVALVNFERHQEDFCQACLQAIDEVWKQGELANHRGWKQIIADLTINLAIFVGTASLSMILSKGTFRFFKPNTDSKNKLQSLEDSLKGVMYIPPEICMKS
jgi:curved DNA-binding protein CbpA